MVHWHIEPRDVDAYAIEGELGFSTDEPDEQTGGMPELADQAVQFNRRLPNEPTIWRMGDKIEVLVDLPADVEQERRLTWVTSGNTHMGMVFRLCVRSLALQGGLGAGSN